MDYKQVDAMLRGRCSYRRKIDNNTYLVRIANGDIVVTLHGHEIVTLRPNGDTVLDSCGWQTMTTKDRMNQFVYVSQEGGRWFADDRPFYDGMVIPATT